jgi:hypothetical protein
MVLALLTCKPLCTLLPNSHPFLTTLPRLAHVKASAPVDASKPSSSLCPSLAWPHRIGTSTLLTVKRSVFLAHASALPSPSAVHDFITHLRTHDAYASRLKRATHCMTAWRAPTGLTVNVGGGDLGSEDDGGERGAGSRLGHLVDTVPADNRKGGIVLVVWRWYGGTPLGGERWRCISSVAREALKDAGFVGNAVPSFPEETQASKKGARKR